MKNTLYILLKIILLSQFVLNCGQGCLRCNTSTLVCQICDGTHGFILQDGKCVLQQQENCLIQSDKSGVCILCKEAYQILNGKCVKKEKEALLDCLIYMGSNMCIKDKKGFPAHDILFDAVNVKIDNCEENETQSTCKRCEQNFVLSKNKTSCISLDSLVDQNCSVFSNFQCLSCQQEYYHDLNNYYLKILNTQIQFSSEDFFMDTYNLIGNKQVTALDTCQQVEDKYCLEFENMKKCKSCQEGFFVNKLFKCEKYPEPAVLNCEVYDRFLNCLKCQSGYILKNSLYCQSIEDNEIQNCLNYSYQANSIVCIECEQQFYLQGQTCNQRTNEQIDNCSKYEPLEDSCKVCQEGFILTQDKLQCYQQLLNCTQDNNNPDTLQCITCNDGYHLDANNLCIQNTITNCKIESNETCQECLIGYTLSNNECIEQQVDQQSLFCDVIDSTKPGSCQTCESQASLFTLVNECQIVDNPIIYCSVYNQDLTCQTCETRYELVNDVCQKMQAIDDNNCLVKDGNDQCILCEEDYYLENGECKKVLALIIQNCEEIQGTGLNTQCIKCDDRSTFVNFNGRINLCEYEQNIQQGNITNCEIYNDDIDKTCKRCIDGYYLYKDQNDTWSCVNHENCSEGLIPQIFDIEDNKYYIKYENVCGIGKQVDNCSVYVLKNIVSQDVPVQSVDYICAECKENYWPIVSTSNVEVHIYNKVKTSDDFLDIQAGIQQCTSDDIVRENLWLIDEDLENCKVLMKGVYTQEDQSTLDYYACHQCKFGYSGEVRRIYDDYFLSTCEPIEGCVYEEYYTGLGSLDNQFKGIEFPKLPLTSYMNCHYCQAHSEIPFIGLIDQDVTISTIRDENPKTFLQTDLLGFDISNKLPMSSSQRDEVSMNLNFCLTIHVIHAFDPDNYFPENCGAGMIVVNRERKNYFDDTSSILCIACEPGYKPIMFTHIDYAISECVRIQNCMTSTRFNGCSQCIEGYVLEYDEVLQQPIIDSCVKSIDNCKYGKLTGECIVCNKGYILHLNGACYLSDILNSNPNNVNSLFQLGTNTQKDLRFITYRLIHETPGISQCNEGFKLIDKRFVNKNICMKNPNLFNFEMTQVDNKSIEFCIAYDSSTGLNCLQCNEGRVLSQDGLICYEDRRLANCQVATNSINCQQCKEEFYLDLDTLNCKFGSIWGCAIYQNMNTCTQCKQNFILNNNKCYQLPELNCVSMSVSGTQITCDQCIPYSYQKVDQVNKNICLPFQQIFENCKNFDQNLQKCLECYDEYYLDLIQNLCIKRNLIENCESYDKNYDKCQTCIQGYRLSLDYQQCLTNPIGVPNCFKYATQTECEICNENLIVKDNICITLNQDQIIPNCKLYKQDGCYQCNSGYILHDKLCIETIINNCIHYESETKCLQCEQGYGLMEDDGILTCQNNKKKNCIEVNDFNYCIQCDNGYYPDNYGNCQPVKVIISGCEQYLDQEHCFKCLPEKILSENKKLCKNQYYYQDYIDSNCSSQQINNQMQCIRCQPGYYFDSTNKCKQCQTGEGCLVCDPFDDIVCLVCQFGYYMEANGDCVFDISLVQQKNVQENISIFKTILMLLLILQLTQKLNTITQIILINQLIE